jgi:hypothetical protein
MPTHGAATLGVVSLMAPNLPVKAEEMLIPATTVEGTDSDGAAFSTSTNSLKPMKTMTNAG